MHLVVFFSRLKKQVRLILSHEVEEFTTEDAEDIDEDVDTSEDDDDGDDDDDNDDDEKYFESYFIELNTVYKYSTRSAKQYNNIITPMCKINSGSITFHSIVCRHWNDGQVYKERRFVK